MIAVFLFCLQFSFAEVAPTGEASSEEVKKQTLEARIESLNTEIDQLRQENLSCKATIDCFFIEVGKKTCGGPEFYVVLSKRSKSIQLIKDKVKEYVKLKEEYKALSGGMFSNCMYVGPAEVACLNNKCQEVLQ
jgi:hypothetical protein